MQIPENVHTERTLFVGDSGTGKTTTAAAFAAAYLAQHRAGYFVVLSTDLAAQSPFARMCDRVLELDDDLAARGVRWRDALDQAPHLYIEDTTTGYPASVLGDLGTELMRRGGALFVADEAHDTVPLEADKRLLQLWSKGRKRAIDCIAITSSAKHRRGSAVNPLIWDQTNVIVSFALVNSKVREKVAEEAPPLGPHLDALKTARDGTPEFGVYVGTGPNAGAELVTRAGVTPLEGSTPA